MRLLKKGLGCILAMTLMATSVVGCAAQKNESNDDKRDSTNSTETVDENGITTFTIFDAGGSGKDPWGERAVAQEITKRTGVKLERWAQSGDATEKLSLMLASGDLPDIIVIGIGDMLEKYIDAGKLIPLDELIDEKAPGIKEMYGETYNRYRYADGKTYYLGNWYGPSTEPSSGYMMKKDYLSMLPSGAKFIDGSQYLTQDDFKQLLKEAKENIKVDGQPVIPFSIHGEGMGQLTSAIKEMNGIKTYHEEDGKLYYDVRSPRYLQGLLYFNELYREGLMDNQWVTLKDKDWQEKMTNEKSFAVTTSYWVPEGNPILKSEKGVDAQYFSYKVVGDGVDPNATTYTGRNYMGWDGIAITTKCKNPEKVIEFFDFLASEEGQYLTMWGVEGEHWNMVDGKHVPTEETLEAIRKDKVGWNKETGVRLDGYFINNGQGSDGTVYDLTYRYELDEVAEHATKAMANSLWDYSEYMNLTPKGGTPLALTNTKVTDIRDRALPAIVNAPSREDAISLYEKMIKDMDDAGAKQVEEEINKNYQLSKSR